MAVERAVAYKASIQDLLEGEFHATEGGYSPSYVQSKGREISRCHLIGTIVLAEQNPVLDDGTGEIVLKKFEGSLSVKEGDIVRVIGKIRENQGERYISVEILKTLNNKKWLELRKKELAEYTQPVEEEKEELEIEELEVK